MNNKQALEFLITLINNYIQGLPAGVKECVVAQAQPATTALAKLVEDQEAKTDPAKSELKIVDKG